MQVVLRSYPVLRGESVGLEVSDRDRKELSKERGSPFE